MNVLTDTWRGLVQRRLWPVALLLLAAAVAVPVLLAAEPEPAPVLPNAAVAPEADGGVTAQPIVAVASATDREAGRDVVGSSKDPFRPAIPARKAPKPKTSSSSTGGSGLAKPAGGSGGSSGGGMSTPSTPSTPSYTPPTYTPPSTTPSAPKTYEVATIAVRFGSSTSTRNVRNLPRLKALPSVAEPVLIYLGLRDDNRTAVFMVEAGALARGDGRCVPSPSDCQTIEIKPGETEFIDIKRGGSSIQYQLDYIKVRRKKATASQARRAYSSEAAGGRDLLRSRLSRVGRWRYDESTGRIKQADQKAYKADAARFSRRQGG